MLREPRLPVALAPDLGLTVVSPSRRQSTLAERYELERGTVFLSGIQALVRLLADQRRADARAGLRVGTFVSGYQGSPLGGFDREVARLPAAEDLVLRPAVNEELGATAVWGSQLTTTLPRPRYDGVLGVWYGKAPGVDRAGDAIRHGNFVGTDPKGGVLALCGDDPACKSSTLPSASESLLAALGVPVFAPGSVQEALDLGRHAIACSRASGLWSAMKVVTAIADATATVEVGPGRVRPVMPRLEGPDAGFVHRPSSQLLAPDSLELERTLTGPRLELARAYSRVNDLNRVVEPGTDARVGLVAAGTTFHSLRRALADLGVTGAAPVRLLQVGMLWPLEPEAIRRFAAGLDEVIVVEEKAPLLESAVRDALYGGPSQPAVLGRRDEGGAELFPAHGALDPDAIAAVLGRRLLARGIDLPSIRSRLTELAGIGSRPEVALGATRTPFFCSGCPHNASTAAPADEVVGAGIGCHTMVTLDREGRGDVHGLTQMGGEGVQFAGAAPFVDVPHFTQNIGDGTFHHSGSLAVRAAVAAGLDITYKLLFNGAVAMTGGQDIEGGMSVGRLARSLTAEGVARIVVTTDEDPSGYDRSGLPAGVEVRGREELEAVGRELAATPGVTVLIHDQACATELRRARKRGKAPEPARRVVINERVCEGCGDCGRKSNCLSVEPVETEFGRKTQIDQTSCNKDYSCLEGDCPSFLTVTLPEREEVRSGPRRPEVEAPAPRLTEAEDVRLRIVGIGGTGVVTLSQVIGMAAMLDGRDADGSDQTGLSQKAGPVVSDLRITSRPLPGGAAIPAGSADLLICLDPLGATAANLRVATPERTRAVVSTTVVPTGPMVVDVAAGRPDPAAIRRAIDAATRSEANVHLDCRRIAETLIGDGAQANVVALGAAWQTGALPISLDALERAFELNGVAVEANLAALAWGRLAVADPAALAAALGAPAERPAPSPAAMRLVERAGAAPGSELRRLLEVRVPDLIGWGGRRAARSYADAVARVRARAAERLGDEDAAAFTEAFARSLHKLTAYKDEYEVARLHLEELGSLPEGSRVEFHLHPPLLRALGMKRKLRLGGWFVPGFRALRGGRVVRGTPLDPFGRSEVRRVERELPEDFKRRIDAALTAAGPADAARLIELADLPDGIRGYEEIKMAGVERYRERADELAHELGAVPR